VTQGNNAVTFTQGKTRDTVQSFNARRGNDPTSGVGTVDAALFVPNWLAAPESCTRSRRAPTCSNRRSGECATSFHGLAKTSGSRSVATARDRGPGRPIERDEQHQKPLIY